MNLEQLIKETFPDHFPIIPKELLTEKQVLWQNEILHLQRLSKYQGPLSSPLNEKLKTLKVMVGTIPELIKHIEAKPSQHIYHLFTLCDTIPAIERVTFWTRVLEVTLIKELNPLSVLLQIGMNTPIHFAGELLYLVQRNTSIHQILTSGFLHRFYGLFNRDEVQYAYGLLRQIENFNKQDALNHCLNEIHLIACEHEEQANHFPDIALDGSFIRDHASDIPLERIHLRPLKFLPTLNLENFSLIYQLFEKDFLMLVLKFFIDEHVDVVGDFLCDTLASKSNAEISTLYQTINKEQAKEYRLSIYRALNDLLSDAQIQAQLKNETIAWFILAAVPRRLNQMSEIDLSHLIQSPMTYENLTYIEALCDNPRLTPHLSVIYFNIFQLILTHPKFTILEEWDDDNLINRLAHFEQTKEWCEEAIARLKSQLVLIIKDNLPFTIQTFQAVYDLYFAFKSQSDFLFSLIPHLSYPCGTYGLHAFIFETLFDLDSEFDISQTIHAIYDEGFFGTYSENDRKTAEIRTLFECLATLDNSALQERILYVLVNHYQQNNWQDYELSYTPLIFHAFFNGNRALLARYFPTAMDLANRCEKIRLISEQMLSERHENFLTYIVQHKPFALRATLEVYPTHELIKALKEQNQYGDCLLHHASPEVMAAILDHVPTDMRLVMVSIYSRYNLRSVIQESLNQLKSFEVILQHLTEAEIMDAMNLVCRNGLLLDEVLKKPKALNILAHHLSENCFIELIEQTDNKQNTYLHSLVNDAEIIAVLMNHVSDVNAYLLLSMANSEKKTPLHLCTSEESLQIMLAKIPLGLRFGLLSLSDNLDNTVFHINYAEYDTLKLLLNAIAIEDRIFFFLQKNYERKTILHLTTTEEKSFTCLLEALPPEKRLVAIKERDSHYNTVLHLCDKKNVLQAALELLPAEDRLLALKEKDLHGNSVLVSSAHFPDKIQIILESIPTHQRLSALIEKDVKKNSDSILLNWALYTPLALKIILEKITPEERLYLVRIKNNYGTTILHKAMFIVESLQIILESLPRQRILNLAMLQDTSGNNPLQWATTNKEALKLFLDFIPPKQRLQVINQKNKLGETLLENLHADSEMVYLILSSLPPQARIRAINKKNYYGNSILHQCLGNLDLIKGILNLLPPGIRLTALKIKNSENQSMMDLAQANPALHEIINVCLDNAQISPGNHRMRFFSASANLHNSSTEDRFEFLNIA